jgi:hypothetical protein
VGDYSTCDLAGLYCRPFREVQSVISLFLSVFTDAPIEYEVLAGERQAYSGFFFCVMAGLGRVNK